jgi:putative transposase
MNIKKNRHSVFDLSYHLVVVTKYRHKCINENVMNDLKDIAKNIFENSWDCEIIEID